MTAPADPLHQYLDQMKTGLRTPEAGRILAEAEDHLRESVAVGRRAGLTEIEAQQAAISSFGSVRAVVRAHQSRYGRAAAVITDVTMAAWKLAWLFLLAYDASTMVMYAYVRMSTQDLVIQTAPSAGGGRPVVWIAMGIAGLPLLAGYHLARRFQRRRGRAVATRVAGVFPLVAVIFFGAATTALVLLNISGAARVGRTLMLACLAVADGYAARMWRTRHHQRTTA
jgi:hypothetical protein